MQMWLKWKFLLDGYGDVKEFRLEPGLRYKMTAALGPNSRLRLLDEDGDSRLAAQTDDQGGIAIVNFIYDDTWGEYFVVQVIGELQNLAFEPLGVNFDHFK